MKKLPKGLKLGFYGFNIKRNYLVEITLDRSKKLSYELILDFDRQTNVNDYSTHNLTIDYKPLTRKYSNDLIKISDELMSCIYPLKVQLNNLEIKSVELDKNYEQRLSDEKKRILKVYTGSVIENYINTFCESIKSNDDILNVLDNSMVFNLFFRPYINDESHTRNQNYLRLDLPIIPYKKGIVDTVVSLEEKLSFNLIELNYEGVFTADSEIQGDMKLSYNLENKIGVIKDLYFECDYNNTLKDKNSHLVIDCTHLAEKDDPNRIKNNMSSWS